MATTSDAWPLAASLGLLTLGVAGWAVAAGIAVGVRRRATAAETATAEAAEAEQTAATERARLDRRLAEVNRMTGGLAHEIKNPLSTIGLNVQLLREDLDGVAEETGDGPGSERLGAIQRRLAGVERETERLRDTLDDFLRFAGRIRLDLGPTDLDAAVEELVDFFEPEAASKGVRLRSERAAGDPVVADAGLFKQALLNLLMNAVQSHAAAATPGGGWVEVHTGPDPADPDRVLVCVSDDGPGVPADRLERIFEPYHTGRRGGSGLGLPTSRRIAELHGGTLTAASGPGPGSTFQLSLPRGGPPVRE